MVLDSVSYEQIKNLISGELRSSWEAQGHNMTGAIIDKLEWVAKEQADNLRIELYARKYGAIIDRGTPASRIPYSGKGIPGRAKTSLYIEGLRRYAEKRMGATGKEALGIAFAIANVQKKEGMPTRNSYGFSKTGERLNWATNVIDDSDIIVTELNRIFTKIFKIRIENRLTNIIKEFNQP
jgi:hypothetical protein